MKKVTIIAATLLLTVAQAFAQKEYKLTKSSGKLVINNISNLQVEGYDGKEIILSAVSKDEKIDDPRAAGLSALSNEGFDNTGIGVSVAEKENISYISPVARDLNLKVKLPRNVALSLKTTGIMPQDSMAITLTNIQSEVDASTQYENIKLINVSGPISVKTLYGYIEGKLTTAFKGPISLVSVYGFVDVTVPENAKADMTISSQYETLYAAKGLNLVLSEPPSKVAYGYALGTANAKLNGQDLRVITSDGNVFTTTAPKIKGNGTTAPIAIAGTKLSDTIKVKHHKNETVIAGVYTQPFPPQPPSVFSFGLSGGTMVNGKLNGGGEKIVLKSTYGKIYLRK
jgi:hypothetical protein